MQKSIELLGTQDVAKMLGVSESTLTHWRCCGDGPAYLKVGRRVFYEPDTVIAWVRSKQRSSTSSEE